MKITPPPLPMKINEDDDDDDDEADKIPTHHLVFCPLVFCPNTHPKRPVNCQVVGTAGKDVVAAGTSCCWAFLIIIDLCCCEYHGWWKTVSREIVDIG